MNPEYIAQLITEDPDIPDPIFYHGTAQAYMPDIQRRGLVPGSSHGMGNDALPEDYHGDRIYLTKFSKYAANAGFIASDNYYVNHHGKITKPVLLEIDMTGLLDNIIYSDDNLNKDGSYNEVMYPGVIPPNRISIYSIGKIVMSRGSKNALGPPYYYEIETPEGIKDDKLFKVF